MGITGFLLLRQSIVDKINSSIASGAIAHIGEAYFSPADITKMPAAVVMPEALESSYQNTAGGRHRTFIFRVYILKGVEGEKQTDVERLLSSAIDELIELFDRRNALTAPGLMHVRPTPSVWDFVEHGGGEARVATMTLSVDIIIETT